MLDLHSIPQHSAPDLEAAKRLAVSIALGNLPLDSDGEHARASSLIMARDCAIMRQMASVIDAAIGGALEPASGRRGDLIPWSHGEG